MTPPVGQPLIAQDLASKASEIEELADAYFFRPLGSVIVRAGRTVGMTPIHLTVIGALAGIAGGALLYDERLGAFAFALLVLHGIFDSADGQLARTTGQVTELGRVLDGAAGYVTHAAIFFAIAGGMLHRGESSSVLIWMWLAGISAAMHAQMYDYHRTAYISVVIEGRAPGDDPATVPSWVRWLYLGYLMMQRCLIGLHAQVEAALATRSIAGLVSDEDRARYRECFYGPIWGWNLLGDNTRFCAIGVLVCLHRTELFFAFVLLPMNLGFIALWLWQRNADRKFLAGL